MDFNDKLYETLYIYMVLYMYVYVIWFLFKGLSIIWLLLVISPVSKAREQV